MTQTMFTYSDIKFHNYRMYIYLLNITTLSYGCVESFPPIGPRCSEHGPFDVVGGSRWIDHADRLPPTFTLRVRGVHGGEAAFPISADWHRPSKLATPCIPEYPYAEVPAWIEGREHMMVELIVTYTPDFVRAGGYPSIVSPLSDFLVFVEEAFPSPTYSYPYIELFGEYMESNNSYDKLGYNLTQDVIRSIEFPGKLSDWPSLLWP